MGQVPTPWAFEKVYIFLALLSFMSTTTAEKNEERRIRPEHKALGEYYFHGKTLEASATLSGLEASVLKEMIVDINKRSILALSDLYGGDISSGKAAENHALTRNELYGFAFKYNFNLDSEDNKSKERIKDLLEGNESLLV